MRVFEIKTLEELHSWIPMIKASHTAIGNPRRANAQIPYEGYVSVIFQCLNRWPEGGIFGAVSDNGHKLGFTVTLNHSELYSNRRTLLAYTVYTNGEDPHTVKQLVEYVENLAREAGYDEVQAHSGRFSGANFRWFTKVLGMKRLKMVYKKDL